MRTRVGIVGIVCLLLVALSAPPSQAYTIWNGCKFSGSTISYKYSASSSSAQTSAAYSAAARWNATSAPTQLNRTDWLAQSTAPRIYFSELNLNDPDTWAATQCPGQSAANLSYIYFNTPLESDFVKWHQAGHAPYADDIAGVTAVY